MFITSLQNKQLQILELYRKIVQGKEMFSTEILSDDERKVLKLLKSFKTPEEKEKFIKQCIQLLNE